MSRLDGRDRGGRRAAAPARERYGAGRLTAGVLLALGGAAAMALHFQLVPPREFASVTPHYVGAALCGFLAGWLVLGMGLGRGAIASAMLSLTSVGVAAVAFCTLAGLKSVVDTYSFGSFSTVMNLFEHLIRRAVETGEAAVASPALLAAGLGGLLVGPLCEVARQAWDVAKEPEV